MLAGIGLCGLHLKPMVAAVGLRWSPSSWASPPGFVPALDRLPLADHRHAEDGLMALPLSYNVRNVRNRWQVTLLAVSGIALVVAVFAVLMSMSEGFAMALRATGSDAERDGRPARLRLRAHLLGPLDQRT